MEKEKRDSQKRRSSEKLEAAFTAEGRKLERSFFVRPGKDKVYAERALKIAGELLGKFLVRRINGKKIAGEIVEVEVYAGTKDRAAHSFGGKVTPRNKIMYGRGGVAYVYLVYGMHWQMNIIVGDSEPHCVLIRALDLGDGSRIASGPGKLCKYMELDKSFHGEDIVQSIRLWVEDRGIKVKGSDIMRDRRIGVDYAGPYWSSRKWRFYMKGNNAVSVKQKTKKSNPEK